MSVLVLVASFSQASPIPRFVNTVRRLRRASARCFDFQTEGVISNMSATDLLNSRLQMADGKEEQEDCMKVLLFIDSVVNGGDGGDDSDRCNRRVRDVTLVKQKKNFVVVLKPSYVRVRES